MTHSPALVFDPVKARAHGGPARHDEDLYSWLDRSSRASAEAARNLINEWFSQIAAQETLGHLRSRLSSNDDSQFAAAFWELYLHERLRLLGYSIDTDVRVRGTSLNIDFLASKPGSRFYVECTSVFKSRADTAQGRREAQIYDVLDQLNTPNFFVWAQKRRSGPRQPPLGRLRIQLETWLNGLNPASLRAAAMAGQIGNLPTFVWRDGGWEYEFKALPKFAAAGKPGVRAVGSAGGLQTIVAPTPKDIRGAISDKVRKYGRLDSALIVALMIDSPAHDEEDTADCLYGESRVLLPRGQTFRAANGLWPEVDREKLYGVVVTCQWSPWKVAAAWPLLWIAPGAPVALGRGLGFPIRLLAPDGVSVNAVPASHAPHEVFGLTSGWPPRP
jgi:hypothetical protein